MKYDETKGHFVMEDGTEYYANGGILGIAEGLEVTQGYDGGVHFEGYDFDEDTPSIKDIHREEMANYMISLWIKFKHSSAAQQPRSKE